MYTNRIYTLLAILIGFYTAMPPTWAQPAPMKFGDVSKEEVAFTTYEADPNASAVILCDFGEVYFNTTGLYRDRHTRIKILKESAYELATVVYQYGDRDDISDIAGQTYVLQADGSVKKIKMEKKDIFYKNISKDIKEVRFTLPALAPGAVIEYRYKQRYNQTPVFLPTWYFQGEAPVLHSELRTSIPRMLSYVFYQGGTEIPFAVQESGEVIRLEWKENQNRWVKKNVPALRKEPYMPALLQDQFSRLEFQLAYIAPVGERVREVLTSWEQVTKELLDLPSFGKQIGKYDEIKAEAREVIAGIGTPEARLAALYAHVQKKLKWNEIHVTFPLRDLRTAFKSGEVDNAEQTMILISMLREAEINAHPILVKTRNQGAVVTIYPLVNQFNYLITYVKIGDKEYLIDATDPNCAMSLLPARTLNGVGWLIHPTHPGWINLSPREKHRHTAVSNLNIGEDGLLTGTLEVREEGYSNLEERARLKEKKDVMDYVQSELFDGKTEVKIEEASLLSKDNLGEPLSIRTKFSMPDKIQAMPDLMYVQTHLFGAWDENPFKAETRTMPLDFIYPREHQTIINLHYPKDFKVEEQPAPLIMRLSEGMGEYRRLIQVNDTTITIISRLMINRQQIPAQYYPEIRAMIEKMVEAHGDQLVLKRKPAETPPPAAATNPQPHTGSKPNGKPAAKPSTKPSGAAGTKPKKH